MGLKREPIKQWLAKLGSERIDEVFDPSLATQRSIDLYRAKGYDEKWISKRMQSIQNRKELTDVWKENGVTEGKEFAILTNEIYKTWSGMTAKEYKEFKGLRKESLRDIAKKKNPKGLNENIEVARRGGKIASNARKDLENEIGQSVVTSNNTLNYEYVDEKEIEMK